MKRILALILSVAMCATLFVGCSAQPGSVGALDPSQDADNMLAKKQLVIGYTIYEPMNYTDAEGNFVGFDTEFAKAVCEKLGVEPVFVEINWDTKFVTLDAGQIDCIWNGMTISDEVKANCDVSQAYVSNSQVVVMAKDKLESYKDVESLKALTFTAEAGSAGETAVNDNGLTNGYMPATTQADAILAVLSGQADACVIDSTMADAMTAEGTDYASLGYSIALTTEEYGIGFRKGSDLTAVIDAAIDQIKPTVLTELATKYGLSLAD